MKIIDRLSPNFNERGGAAPTFLILHYTGMKTAEEALQRLCDGSRGQDCVSSHYVVDEDGTVYRLVDEGKRAWHAGESFWGGTKDLNTHSIGIEIVNPGHEFGYRPFPVRQMDAVIALCRDILSRHDIPPHQVLAHSDVAPARKEDPGELFDWKLLARKGVGAWPEAEAPENNPGRLMPDDRIMREALTAYGYDPACDLKTAITAFQRHFHPEIFRRPDRVGSPDPQTAARLHSLLRLRDGPKS